MKMPLLILITFFITHLFFAQGSLKAMSSNEEEKKEENERTSKKSRVYKINEAYILDESGGHDLMKTVLNNSPAIYYVDLSSSDSILIVISNINDDGVILVGKGLEINDKAKYMEDVKYYDKDKNEVVPDINQMSFYELRTTFIFFKEDGNSKVLVAKEKITDSIEKYGEQLFLFTFFIDNVHLQIYAVEM